METLYIIIIGVAAAASLAWALVLRSQRNEQKRQLDEANLQLDEANLQLEETKRQLDETLRLIEEKARQLEVREVQFKERDLQLMKANAQCEKMAADMLVVQEQKQTLMSQCEAQKKEIEMLKAHGEEMENLRREQFEQQQRTACEQFTEQQRTAREQFEQQLRTAREQIANVAQKVLEDNAKKFKAENTDSMDHITAPLKEAIGDVRRAINDSMKDSAQHSASFREQMRVMMEHTKEISEKAEGLTNVLRRDNKVSGNMGEIILGDLLASQGLTEGIHYEVQTRIKDEAGRAVKNDDTGREMQPDVILHYPQGQDAIIDSKVSLTAYERYVNAETPDEKARHLQDHVKSVRQHVGELARKDYSKYIKASRKAVDFVIMFVPFESSLQLALANDPTLWREAFEKKVFITGEQNLLGILHIIHIAWVQNQQAENQQKVFGLAEQLLDRMGDFIQRYQDLGEKLQKVNTAYDYANNKLCTGTQSVTKKAHELVDLGAKENANRRIPKE